MSADMNKNHLPQYYEHRLSTGSYSSNGNNQT